jgi:type II secretion system protein N
MRLPSLRLPALRRSVDRVEGSGGRSTALYALYTAVLFLVFMVVNFPHHVVVQRFLSSIDLQEQGLRLEVGDTRFAWWRGYELQRVRLASVDPAQPPFLELGSLYVRPGMDGLWRGELNSAQLLGLMYGGEVAASLANADGAQRANISFDRIAIHEHPMVATLLQEGVVTGVLSGAIAIERNGEDESNAAGELYLDKASLTDAKVNISSINVSLPALHFDKAAVKFSTQGGRLDIQELEADGPDVMLSLNGQIALREPVYDSVLNLKLSAVPGPESPEEVKNLLALLPPPPKGSKPDTPHVISGTLARPRVR